MNDIATIEPHERDSATIKIKCGDVLVIKDKTYYAIYHRDNGYCIVDEAVDLIYSVLNNGTDKDDIVESLEHHYIDCGLMSEEEFRERCV